MKNIENLVSKAVTAIQATPTPEISVNMQEWGKFFNFSTEGDTNTRKQLEAMLRQAALFVRSLKHNHTPRWLSLLGTSGCGKTFLSKRIWRWFKSLPEFRAIVDEQTEEIIYPGSFVLWPNLAAELLSNSGYIRLNQLKQEKLVVIDEIGADRDPSGHVRDCLSRLLTARVGKWTVITSNKSLNDIERDIDARVSSRMIRDGNVVVDVAMKDYALRRA